VSRELWLNPGLGVAGDMLLGALLDVGASEDATRRQLEQLGVVGWELDVHPARRRGLRATRAEVRAETQHHHRPWSSIDRLLAECDLDGDVRAGARTTFRLLAEAEAGVHGIDVDEVHFHEVGAVDALVDIVGTWAALATLDVGRVVSAPVGLGAATVRTAHGLLPAPAPATLALLEGLPVAGIEAPFETATPTGVALLATLVDEWGPPPPGVVVANGFGAGGRDPDSHPNVVAAVLLDARQDRRVEAVLVETNLDDVSPEVLGHVIDEALRAGADDAWVTAITMKKSRPAHQLRVLCPPALAPLLVELVARETGTLGIRSFPVAKHVLPRSVTTVEVAGHRIDVKVGPHGAKPEHDQVIQAARMLRRSARSVADEVMFTWRIGANSGDVPAVPPESPR
jgi:uncharacterized protein (TIGR00299 family) protein